MADKKYYWLRLHRDFFKRHDIQIIEDMENGKDYILFYLKLLVESIDHEGQLRFSDAIPYNDKMLATVTHTNVDVVRSAMKVFEELQMITILDDETIYMQEVSKMIGFSTQDDHTRESTRLRVQKYRDNQKTLQKRYSNVTCNGEIDIEIDKDIDIYKEKESIKKKKVTVTEESVIFIPLNDGTEHGVTQKQIDEWKELYPAVDVMQELRNMRGWCLGNPSKRKTKSGVNRFINSWLSREQNRGGGNGGSKNNNSRVSESSEYAYNLNLYG